MYRSFYGLRERPFDLTPNPQYLVLTQGHREALGHMEYAIASRKGMTLLLGEAGTGKTTVVKTALESQPARTHCVHLQNPVLTRAEFIEMLAVKFALPPEARRSKTALLLELEKLLRERDRLGEPSVLVVDEAQSIPLDVLEEIRLLANMDAEDGKLLSVVLAGQPELAQRLNQDDLRQLKQRIALRCELRPLNAQETPAYIAGRIRAAGGIGAHLFTREAVILMHERSRGIPRTISVIADNALVTGFALGQRPVTAATIEEVCRDFDLTGGAAPDVAREEAHTLVVRPAPPAVPPRTAAPAETAAPAHDVDAGRTRVLTFQPPPGRTAATGPQTAEREEAADAPDAEAVGESARKRRRFLFF